MKRDYKVPHKRRRQKKTDYKLRLALLKRGSVRLVVRKSNKYIMGQIVKYEKNGDKTLICANSRELKNMGWKKNCGNIPSAYLTGLLLGMKSKEKKIYEATLDLGLQTSTKGNRLYAFLKGVLDSGMKVNHNENIIPSEDRLNGKHIDDKMKDNVNSIKNKIMK